MQGWLVSEVVGLRALGLQWLPGNWLAVPGQEASILLGRTIIDDAKKLRRSLPRIEELRFGYVALEGARKICIDGPRMKRHADDVACATSELDGERASEHVLGRLRGPVSVPSAEMVIFDTPDPGREVGENRAVWVTQ